MIFLRAIYSSSPPEFGKTEVIQLQRDLSTVQFERESIMAFATSDPDIAQFIKHPVQPTHRP